RRALKVGQAVFPLRVAGDATESSWPEGDAWKPIGQPGNPCNAPLFESHLTWASEEQRRGEFPVELAGPLFVHSRLFGSMRTRAQLSRSLWANALQSLGILRCSLRPFAPCVVASNGPSPL
ncbi:unnamed protein product, partial [Pylaiella littoralis]